MTAPYQLGVNIRRLRIAAGLSQVQLAKISGIPQQAISRIENGGMSLGSLCTVARALKAEVVITPQH